MNSVYCFYCNQLVSPIATVCEHCHQLLVLRDNYRLLGRLGQGGFGVVYKARDQEQNRHCAIKVILAGSLSDQRQAETEAHILERYAPQLSFIPRIFDIWSERSQTFLVMEYIEGQTLDLTIRHSWPLGEVEQFLRTMLQNLAQLHAIGIVHRDIKPSNITRTPDKRYILLDFGIAKNSQVTQSGAKVALSPAYAAPEQLQGLGTDKRTDLYSLAATTYHLLTGSQPLPAIVRLTGTETLQRPSELVPHVSQHVEQVILNMLALQPDRRPIDAQAALNLLSSTAATLWKDDGVHPTLSSSQAQPEVAKQMQTQTASPASISTASIRLTRPLLVLAGMLSLLAGLLFLFNDGQNIPQQSSFANTQASPTHFFKPTPVSTPGTSSEPLRPTLPPPIRGPSARSPKLAAEPALLPLDTVWIQNADHVLAFTETESAFALPETEPVLDSFFTAVEVAPDGSFLAYAAGAEGLGSETLLFIKNIKQLHSGELLPLPWEPVIECHSGGMTASSCRINARFAPDRQAFAASIWGESAWELWLYDIETGGLRKLLDNIEPHRTFRIIAWTAQGIIADQFASSGEIWPDSLVLIDPETGAVEHLRVKHHTQAVVAPNGTKIAFTVEEAPGLLPQESLSVLDLTTNHQVTIAPLSSMTIDSLRWSPDSTQLLYLRAPDFGAPASSLHIFNLKTGEEQVLSLEQIEDIERLHDVHWRTDQILLFLAQEQTSLLLYELSLSEFGPDALNKVAELQTTNEERRWQIVYVPR